MFLYQLINVYYSYKLSNYVVINSNTYKIRLPVVYSLVVYFLHVEIHSMKLKKIYSFAHCLELIKMDLLEKGSADVLYTSDFLCKYIVIIASIVSILKKKIIALEMRNYS